MVIVLNLAEGEVAAGIMAALVEEQGEVPCSVVAVVLEGLVLALVLPLAVVLGVVIPQVMAVLVLAMTMRLVLVTVGVDRFWPLMALMAVCQVVEGAVVPLMVRLEQAAQAGMVESEFIHGR